MLKKMGKRAAEDTGINTTLLYIGLAIFLVILAMIAIRRVLSNAAG